MLTLVGHGVAEVDRADIAIRAGGRGAGRANATHTSFRTVTEHAVVAISIDDAGRNEREVIDTTGTDEKHGNRCDIVDVKTDARVHGRKESGNVG